MCIHMYIYIYIYVERERELPHQYCRVAGELPLRAAVGHLGLLLVGELLLELGDQHAAGGHLMVQPAARC